MPIVSVCIGVALLLLLMIVFKLNAFISLILVSLVVGILEGMSPLEAMTSVQGGLGGTLGSLTMIIIFGAILGKLMTTPPVPASLRSIPTPRTSSSTNRRRSSRVTNCCVKTCWSITASPIFPSTAWYRGQPWDGLVVPQPQPTGLHRSVGPAAVRPRVSAARRRGCWTAAAFWFALERALTRKLGS